MQKAKANLLLLPIAGVTKPGDFDHFTRMRCYQKVAAHYPPDSYVLNLLPLAMRMAGPREAVLHMIIGKNFGCTHFVIGHDHASPGNSSSNIPFYQYDEATQFARSWGLTSSLLMKWSTYPLRMNTNWLENYRKRICHILFGIVRRRQIHYCHDSSGSPLKPTVVLLKFMCPRPSLNVKNGTEKACMSKPGPVF